MLMHCTVCWINATGGGRIGVMPRPRGNNWLDDEIKSLAAQKVHVVVSLLTSQEVEDLGLTAENELCVANGIEFLSFPINDREVPALDAKLKDFIRSLQERAAQGKSIVVHCQAGIGRSAIIAACLLILGGTSAEQALSRIEQARGFPVPDTQEQLKWVGKFAEWHAKEIK